MLYLVEREPVDGDGWQTASSTQPGQQHQLPGCPSLGAELYTIWILGQAESAFSMWVISPSQWAMSYIVFRFYLHSFFYSLSWVQYRYVMQFHRRGLNSEARHIFLLFYYKLMLVSTEWYRYQSNLIICIILHTVSVMYILLCSLCSSVRDG